MLTRMLPVFLLWLLSMPAVAQDIRQPGQTPRPAQPGQVQPRSGFPNQPLQPGQQPLQPGQVRPGQQPFVRALQPAWVPLPADHQNLVKQILQFWENRSAKVKVYQCEFQRWKYDPVFVPADPKTGKPRPQEYSKGYIKYAMPDKALYKDTETHVYDPTSKNGWKKLPADSGHHWICDGTSILEFVAANKQVVKTELPPEMRGEALRTRGPLPFLFGAKADEIQRRYWVRVVTPQGVTDRYHLEAWPKQQADAANFKLVEIILDRKKYLPVHLVVYNVNYTPKNPAKTSYQFTNASENPFDITKLFPWKKEFFQPAIPKGWKLVNQPVGGPPRPVGGVARPAGGPPGPGGPATAPVYAPRNPATPGVSPTAQRPRQAAATAAGRPAAAGPRR